MASALLVVFGIVMAFIGAILIPSLQNLMSDLGAGGTLVGGLLPLVVMIFGLIMFIAGLVGGNKE